ncbi:MAG TPA: NAD(P)H-hydrate dehydratase [Stellaceae bacterium]|jgi:hydroxyethylthiazole kinase-like uncharacterized protein yjeF
MSGGGVIPLDEARLRTIPLPLPDEGSDKNTRGRVLVIGGAREVPGAIVLAGTAALRAGAGKLQLATVAALAPHVAIAVPESRVGGTEETETGDIAASAAKDLAERASRVDAVLIGPGMMDAAAAGRVMAEFLPALAGPPDGPALVVDAVALMALRDDPSALHRFGGRVMLTPHAGEMAGLLGIDKHEIEADPAGVAHSAAERFRAVVALKGATTHVATPEGEIYCHTSGCVGLATSGSGDTLAGIVAGLAARGAGPLEAALWGVFLHGAAGRALNERHGLVGFLARELLDEIPGLMQKLS